MTTFAVVEEALKAHLKSMAPNGTKPRQNYRDALMKSLDKIIIESVLKRKRYNQSATARELDINRNTLRYRIREYGIDISVKSEYL